MILPKLVSLLLNKIDFKVKRSSKSGPEPIQLRVDHSDVNVSLTKQILSPKFHSVRLKSTSPALCLHNERKSRQDLVEFQEVELEG